MLVIFHLSDMLLEVIVLGKLLTASAGVQGNLSNAVIVMLQLLWFFFWHYTLPLV